MQLDSLLQELGRLKEELNQFLHQDNHKIQATLAIEYTYESNRIEDNTLTLQETQLVIENELTINGKSLREHLEAINHYEAIDYIKELTQSKSALTEHSLKQIHTILLRSIDNKNAGAYR